MRRPYTTSRPRLRAVPSTVFTACSRLAAVRSGILMRATSSTCWRVTCPTVLFPGSAEPFSIPAARFKSTAAGVVLVMKVKDRSAYTVMMTGMMRPACACVWALNALQNSMMLTPRWPSAGPTGGLGFAAPAGTCSLISAMTFFMRASRLLHLHEVELHGGGAPEDADQHAQLPLVRLHLLDHAVEVLEGAVDHLHLLALLEEDLGLRLDRPLGHLLRDLAHLGLGDGRGRARIGRAAEEAGHLGRRLDDVPGRVVELPGDDDVAGEELARRGLLLPLDQLDHLLRRHQDLAEQIRLAEPADALLERRLHLVLVAGVRVHHVPAPLILSGHDGSLSAH